jgi:hypothetical protein
VNSAPAIAVDALEKRYGATLAVDGLSLTIPGATVRRCGPASA